MDPCLHSEHLKDPNSHLEHLKDSATESLTANWTGPNSGSVSRKDPKTVDSMDDLILMVAETVRMTKTGQHSHSAYSTLSAKTTDETTMTVGRTDPNYYSVHRKVASSK